MLAPTDASVCATGDPVMFTGLATDFEEGDISGRIDWTSSLTATAVMLPLELPCSPSVSVPVEVVLVSGSRVGRRVGPVICTAGV